MLQQYFIFRAVFNSSGKLKRCIPAHYSYRPFQDIARSANARGICMLVHTDQKIPLSNTLTSSTRSVNQSVVYYSRSTTFTDSEESSDSSEEISEDDIEERESEYLKDGDETNGINSFTRRSHTCGELNVNHVGESVQLYGWIEAQRGNNFVILHDAYGSVQICFAESEIPILDPSVPVQSVISVDGEVVRRSPDKVNKEMATGEIEVIPQKIRVLSPVSKPLPFTLKGSTRPKENLAMKHRYLYLRFPEMQEALRVRSAVLHKMRCFLVEDCSFVEVETPTLFGKTPGGAQEFVVPTQKGKCYSLVQSPQQFKQMLMVGGIDRYFQVARCYRDEDSRADRQPEFTQLDMEVSFADMNDIMSLTEQVLKHSWPEEICGLQPLPLPLPRMTYADAIAKYGTDAPDLRYDTLIENHTNPLTAYVTHRRMNSTFTLTFRGKAGSYSEEILKAVDKLLEGVRSQDETLFVRMFRYEEMAQHLSPVFTDSLLKEFINLFLGQPGDLVIVAYGHEESANGALGTVRVPVSKMLGIEPSRQLAPLWVTHFPLFKKGPRVGKFLPIHHPFTTFSKQCENVFLAAPLEVEALSYDLVLNGVEIGGGSERIRDSELQMAVLDKIGADPAALDYFLDALSSGCPPHAGIALGIDRLMACLLKRNSIRDVIAFPKTVDGKEPLTGAPKPASAYDKARYKLK